jgi:Cu(I)/Ag(I) efflux system membrane fusion protein
MKPKKRQKKFRNCTTLSLPNQLNLYAMKITSIPSLFFLSCIAFALLSNCSGNKKDIASEHDGAHAGHDSTQSANATTTDTVNAPHFQVDKSFQGQLSQLFSSYVELKEAFVSSDVAKVKQQSAAAQVAVGKIDMTLLTGAAHNDWMAYLSPIEKSLADMQEGSDIDSQRKAFSTLSDNLYKAIKAFGLGGKQAYYDFCPMAFNNEGAYWLSDETQIRNPYFGDKMLACGSIQETLQ